MLVSGFSPSFSRAPPLPRYCHSPPRVWPPIRSAFLLPPAAAPPSFPASLEGKGRFVFRVDCGAKLSWTCACDTAADKAAWLRDLQGGAPTDAEQAALGISIETAAKDSRLSGQGGGA